jgi:hypothetical protein
MSQDAIVDYSYFLQQLNMGLKSLEGITDKHQDAVVELKVQTSQLKEEVDKLARIVRDGNGSTPLSIAVPQVTHRVNNIEKKLDLIDKRKWQIMLALVGGIIGLVSPVIAYILTK